MMKGLSDLIIPPAYAQTIGGFGGFDFMSLLPIVLIFVVFYYFLIRPQQKKAQQHKELLTSLRRGDRIITNGGLIGVIHKVVSDQELQVEIAEGIRVRIARAMIADRLSRTEPTPESSDNPGPSEKKKPKGSTMKKTLSRKKKAS